MPRRDDDFIRELLLEFEAMETHVGIADLSMSPTPARLKRHYHAELLADAGLFCRVGRGTYRLTSQGHDYLDAIRDEGIWQETKKAVADTGGSVTLEIVKALAIGFLKKHVKEKTGLDL